MANLASILTDPNYVNANPATKAAIFDKFSAQDPNYTNANPATQQAIRAKFGVAEPPQEAPAETATEIPFGRKAIEFVRPTVEALGSVGGAALGTPAGPLGIVGGAGLGYGLAKGGLDTLETALGYRQGPTSAPQAILGAASDVGVGGLMEGIGRGVIGPVFNYVGTKAGKVVDAARNVKMNTLIDAVEGKGDEIVNLLRGAPSAVPGAAPTAGEVAAPAGSARFSALQEQLKKVKGAESKYASQAAQTNEARLAQQARVDAQFAKEKTAAQNAIEAKLTTVSQRETGQELIDAAKAEKTKVKKSVVEPAYKAAFDAAGGSKVNVDSVVVDAEKILGRKLSTFDPSTAPSTVRKLLSLRPATPEPKPIGSGVISSRMTGAKQPQAPANATLEQLDDIRKAINADIASASRSSDPAAATTLMNLRQLHKSIDNAVDGSKTLPDEAKALYTQAVDTYKTEYAPRFKEGVNAKLFKKTTLNETAMNPDDVVKTYFQPKGEREASQFVLLFGKKPQAMATAREGIEDLYRREVTDAAGNVTPEAHAKFLKKYADPLRILDEAGMGIRTRIDAVGQNANKLAQVNERAAASSNKLAPAIASGPEATAIEKRIANLTKGLTPQQLQDVNAVRADLLRQGDYERLAAAGSNMGVNTLATKAGRAESGPIPQTLNFVVNMFNNVYKRLAGKMDDKVARDLAMELTQPATAANAIEAAMRLQRNKQLSKSGRVLSETGRAATIGANALASENQNALAP
jgi:hypothetical protein